VLSQAGGNSAGSPVVAYDPVARVVSLSNPTAQGDGGAACWLQPNQFYQVNFAIPNSPQANGLRAIDGATLDPAGAKPIGFNSGPMPCSGSPPAPPRVHFCVDIWSPIFSARCSAPQCHGAPTQVNPQSYPQFPDGFSRPAASLVLATTQGVGETAIGRVAQGSNTGPLAKAGAPGFHFGVDMPIIDQGDSTTGNPGNSWLMYKLLLAPPPDASVPNSPITCGSGMETPAPSFGNIHPGVPMSDAERARLSNFIVGREMPFPSLPGAGDPVPPTKTADNPTLSIDELERVQTWIANGAPLEDCTQCAGVDAGSDAPPGDGGSGDAPPDAPQDAPRAG